MNKKTFFALGIAAMLSTELFAQQDTSASNQLDEVVITATKYPVKLSTTGKVVTVITQQQIARSAGKDIAQLLNEQTGVVINGANSGAGKDKSIFMRGAKNDYTLILIDGIALIDPSSIGALDLRSIPLSEVERIEILKGSQSSLYGSDAVAGVINIITKKGSGKKINASVMAAYNSYKMLNTSATLHGSTSVVDYNVNYSHSSGPCFSEAKDTTGHAMFDKDTFNRNSFQSRLTFKPAKNLKLSPFYRYSYLKGNMDGDAFVDSKDKYNCLTNNIGLSSNYKLPKGELTAIYSYSYTKRHFPQMGSEMKGKFHNTDVYINYSLSNQIQLLAGVNFQQHFAELQFLPYFPADTSNTSLTSPYISLFVQSGTGLNVEIGGRYNKHSKFGDFSTYSINTSYKANEQLKFFANVSTGFKAPSYSQLFFYKPNPNIKSETSNNLEGGFQLNLPKQKANITATVFARDINNIIDYINMLPINIDKKKDKGVELEIVVKPIEKLDIKASYTYVTGNITQRREGKDTTFFKLLRVPKNRFTMTAGYEVNKNFFVSTSLQTVGKRDDLYFNPSNYSSEPISLKSYALVNAYAEYHFSNSKYKIFIDAKNITNAKYYEVYGYSVQGADVNGGVVLNF